MRGCLIFVFVATSLIAVCRASAVNPHSESTKMRKVVSPAVVSLDNAETNKRSLRMFPGEKEERAPKTLKTPGERVMKWLRKNKDLEDVKKTLMVTELTKHTDPTMGLYKQFGKTLLKSQEPKDLYKQWLPPTKWDKARDKMQRYGCLVPPCVAPMVIDRL
ncbi:RxLR effector protein [Phytophthora megakarya]|uniref:RxLR effector protein n=1 Tax=Phytophthora megakarya TaxID=4795 RepID=A0A225VTN9_9STRA|nr:RxLR effector protein [Phytophthora megakarya]